jgi:regulator of protease activity HflC (stomatin/prohibitin superfamily)
MELEKRSEIERNAAITRAEGQKIAAISQAEGEKAAAIAKAEGEREALRTRAEGERDASRLRAEGRAQAYASLFSAIKNAGVDGSVLSIRYLEALENVANGNATTLIMPSDSSSVLAAVAQMTQTMAATGAGAAKPGTRKIAPEPIHPEEPFDPDLAPV